MPGMCSVPGCKGYKKARSRGVVFHSLPTRDPERCRKWLKAIQSPRFDENTPVSKYGNIRVCSQHFNPEDYEPDIQAEVMKTTPRKILKSTVIPTVFSGRQQEDLSTFLPADDRSRTQITSGAPDTSPQPPPPGEPSESLCSVASVDRLNESFHQETELSSTATSKSDEKMEKDLSQSKTIVNDSCLMELFKRCQTCGQPITKKKVSHCGAQKKVRWSCRGGHRGIWMSSPHLWEAFPEIHLLTTFSVLFSGGTFTHFQKWAKHLHLNFMGHKTFFEIQKAYLNPEITQVNRTEQEGIFAKRGHQQSEDTFLHMSDHLKKFKEKSRRREKGALSSRSSYEKICPTLMTSPGTCMQEKTAQSSLGRLLAPKRDKQCQQDDVEHQSETKHMASEVDGLQDSFEEMEVTINDDECSSVKNRLSDLDSDLENVETTELSAPRADDNCEEDAYVPIIPQRSKTSEFLLECEEEELEPWQKNKLNVPVKEEDDVGDFNDQTDCKPDPSSLQSWSAGQHTPTPETCGVVHNSEHTLHVHVKKEEDDVELIDQTDCKPDPSSLQSWSAGQHTPTPETCGVVHNSEHTLHVHVKKEEDDVELNDQTDCKPDPSSLQSWSAGQHTPTPETCGVVHNSEHTLHVHVKTEQISNNPSVQSPEVCATSSNQLQSEQSNSQTLSASLSLPDFPVIKLESTDT